MFSVHNQNIDDFPQELKQKQTNELIQIALTANDDGDNLGWDAIWVLRYRATREVFDAAKKLCESVDPLERTVGVDILAQLGLPTRTFLDETLELFFKLMDIEHDHRVLNSLGVGLGHISPEPRKVQPLLKLKNHINPNVRFGVVFGLSSEEDPLAIQALIKLSSDEDDAVRDWATFALGTQTNLDSLDIREALFRRAIDTKDTSNAVGEGLVGLAKRQDKRVFELIQSCLETGNAGTLVFEAAEILADPRLYLVLIKLGDSPNYANYERQCLADAIVACNNPV